MSCLWLLALQLPADATTLIPMDEHQLAARAVAAVTGTVRRIESAAGAPNGPIFTYVFIEPEEVIFGTLPAGEIVLRELGGTLRTRREWVFGSPEYYVGESLLVFLSRNADGTLRTTAKCLGKYQLGTTRRGTRIATRHIGRGVTVLSPDGRESRRGRRAERYHLQRLVARIRRATNPPRRRTGRVELVPRELLNAALSETHAAFTLLGPESRWFEPDDGEPLLYAIDSTGDEKFGPEGSLQLIQDAFDAWSSIPSAALELGDGGAAEPAPFAGCPDDNRIVFNDPFEEIEDPTNCRGFLALGGFCANTADRKIVNGVRFQRITTGKVTFNNGWSDCPIWTSCNVAEIATHELGHTLGFGHSADEEATMTETAHFDGRCATLREDDVAAASFVYPAAPSPTPSGTPDWSPTPSRTPTVSPTATRSGSPTRTPTRTRRPTLTRTATRTRVPTRTRTPTRTRRPTLTRTATRTRVRTRTATGTRTPLSTATQIASPTVRSTPSVGEWLQSMRRVLSPLAEMLSGR